MATANTCNLLQTYVAATYATSGTITVTAMTAGSGVYVGFLNTTDGTTNFVTAMSGGGTWTRQFSKAQGSGAVELWYLENATGGTTSISFTTTKSGTRGGAEFSGAIASSSADTSGTAGVTGTTQTLTATTSGNITNNCELLITVAGATGTISKGGGVSGAVPSGFTNITNNGSKGGTTFRMDYRIFMGGSGATTSVAQVCTSSSSASFAVGLAAFKFVTTLIQPRDARTGTNNFVTLSAAGTTLNLAAAPIANNLLILLASNQSGLGGTLNGAGTITQTNQSYTNAGSTQQGTGATAEIQYAVAAAAGGTTLTFANSIQAHFEEWFGLASSNPLDVQAGSIANCAAGVGPTTCNTGSVTTTQAVELAVCLFSCDCPAKGAVWTAPSGGFTTQATYPSKGGSWMVGTQILNSTSTVSSSSQLNTTVATNQYATMLATFGQTPTVTSSGHRLCLLGAGP